MGTNSSSGTLEDERQALARQRILRAGRDALREIGADATMDQIAELANVARRTVFRYYPSRDELIRDTLLQIIEDYVGSLPVAKDYDDLESWLFALASVCHRQNAHAGPGYWELIAARHEAGPIADALDERHRRRLQLSNDLAVTAWKLAGRKGRPSKLVSAAFALTLGPLATAVLAGDLDMEVDESARITVGMLLPLLDR